LIQLTFLGTADAFNGAGRANSCYWIQDAHGHYVVDFGPTALLQCRKLGLDPGLLDAVYLTHLHGDHLGGLALLYIDLLFIRRRTRPLLIAGPPGSEARVMALLESAYPSVLAKGAPFELRFWEWPVPGEVVHEKRRIRTVLAKHDTQAVASSLRIEAEGEKVLAFSGDTGWQPELAEIAAGRRPAHHRVQHGARGVLGAPEPGRDPHPPRPAARGAGAVAPERRVAAGGRGRSRGPGAHRGR
jgi:ribonuclease BN (tRNA processing enzyme)